MSRTTYGIYLQLLRSSLLEIEINSDKDVENKLICKFHCRITVKCRAVTVSVKMLSAHHPIFLLVNV